VKESLAVVTAFIINFLAGAKKGWGATRAFLIAELRGQFVKLMLKKLLGSSMAGGFRAWLVKFIAKNLYDEIAEPLVKAVLRKAHYKYRVREGRVIIKKLEEAEQRGDNEDYDRIVNDLFR
jgi:hypothetical protein